MTRRSVTIVTSEGNNRSCSLGEVIKLAAAAGKAMAAGGDALPALAREVVLAASKGVLSVHRNGDNERRDDATRIYGTYVHAREQGATLDVSRDGSGRTQISKLRQLVKMGLGPGDPLGVIDQVVRIHQDAWCEGKSVSNLYGCMVAVARSQLKLGRDLTKDEITDEVCKIRAAAPNPTAADQLEKIDLALTQLIDGGERSPEVSKARGLIRQRLMVLRNVPEPSHSDGVVTLEHDEYTVASA